MGVFVSTMLHNNHAEIVIKKPSVFIYMSVGHLKVGCSRPALSLASSCRWVQVCSVGFSSPLDQWANHAPCSHGEDGGARAMRQNT
jgi:hypothetical protein